MARARKPGVQSAQTGYVLDGSMRLDGKLHPDGASNADGAVSLDGESRRDGASANPRRAAEPPIKATFYLSRAAAETLEDGWYNLRKIAPHTRRASVTKSLLVRLAIELALQEFKTDGKSSTIAKRMLDELDASAS